MSDRDEPDERDPKPATIHTLERHSSVVVDFDDDLDVENASRGLIANLPGGRVERDDRVVWDSASHDFLRTDDEAPPTVHPGLWRQGKLNAVHGLFEVADGVWQARSYDIANITFLAGADGWVVIDPLTNREAAAACLALANDHLGERPVTAVIYTHSHLDHFGGILGVTSREAVDRGDVRVIAPEGFLHEAVGENVLAGPAMLRRSTYQFGPLLPTGPTGQVDVGLGQAVGMGRSDLVAPTETIHETGEELVVDGIRIVFQNTPDAEAPSEMNFFFPDRRLLCMAENCTHTLHNLYPIRGAKVRDALAWSKYIHEAMRMWGDDTDTMFASHHWPRFGGDDVRRFLALQRDVYRWIHDQTLRLANHGYRPDEISEALTELPECFTKDSHVRGYYGTVSHNARSVYARYLGWYDGNPAHLHPHPPVEAGTRYVEAMGGPDAVVRNALRAFDEGDYRWVVEVLDHLIFSDPGHREARLLSADAMEQLGYQAESGTWRNAYLMGAFELRHGSLDFGPAGPPPLANGMTGEQLVDMIGVRLDPTRLNGEPSFVFVLTDLDERHRLTVEHAAVHHDPAEPGADADATVTADRQALVEVLADPDSLDDMVAGGRLAVDGDDAALRSFLAALDRFSGQHLVEP